MPNYYANLPAPQFQNALLDLAPVNNALEGVRDQNNANRNALLQQSQLDMRKEENTYQRGRDAKQDAWQQVQRGGQMADAIQRLPDGPQKQSAWGNYLKTYGDGNHTPEELDYRTGPAIAAAAAGKFLDPMEKEAANLDMQYKRAQIRSLDEKANDPIAQMLAERLQRASRPQPQAQPQPQAPLLQPQSYQGGPAMPGVQLISDEQAAAPQQPAQAPAPDMIDTPFGQMTRDEARDLAGPMLLNPKYSAAGKAILDSIGGTGAAGMSKPAETKLDEGTISSANTLGRIREIRSKYKPQFATIPGKLKMLGASWSAALTGKLNPEMTKELSDFAKYKTAGFDNFNQLLKELSGTAVSAQELSRQKIVQPNPGEGILDGDDPITFEAKMDQGERLARSAIARMNFMRSRGLQFNKDTAEQFMRLEDVPAAIEKRGAEIEQKLRQTNPQASPQSLEQETARRLKQEFGI